MNRHNDIVPAWKRQHAKTNRDIRRWALEQFEYGNKINQLITMDEEDADFKRAINMDNYLSTEKQGEL